MSMQRQTATRSTAECVRAHVLHAVGWGALNVTAQSPQPPSPPQCLGRSALPRIGGNEDFSGANDGGAHVNGIRAPATGWMERVASCASVAAELAQIWSVRHKIQPGATDPGQSMASGAARHPTRGCAG